MELLEMKMYRNLNPILKSIWFETSEKIKHGDPLGIVPSIVNGYTSKIKNIFLQQYKLIGEYNYKQVTNRVQEVKPKKIINYYYKDGLNNFWYYFDLWSKQQALAKVAKINDTTKNILKTIIDKGIKDGKSYAEINKTIKDTLDFTKNRSMMIAVTETHTAFNKSIFDCVKNADIKMETKEWLNAGDERVRDNPFDHVKANGETVAISDSFKETGEDLDYPGDPSGDPANIIRCRCIALYSTVSDISMEE